MSSLALSKVTPQEFRYQLAHWDDNRGYVVTAVTTTFYALAFVFVVLRFLAIRKIGRKLKIEDYTIAGALFLATGLWTISLLLVRYGAGIHSIRVVKEHGIYHIVKTLQLLVALQFTYHFNHLVLKLSILILYKSLFTFVMTAFKRAWYCILAYVVANFTVCIVIILTQCRPFSYSWNEPLGMEGTCINLKVSDIGNGITVSLADLMLLILPMPVLWTLHIPRRTKILLCGLFAIGLLSITASIVRLWYMTNVVSSVDLTYIQVEVLIWSVIEVDLGIVCACFPTLKPLWSREEPRTSSAISQSTRLTPHYDGRDLESWRHIELDNVGDLSKKHSKESVTFT